MNAPTYPIPTLDLRAAAQGMSRDEWKRLLRRTMRESARIHERARYERSIQRWREWTVETKCAALLAGEPLGSIEMPKFPTPPRI